MGLSLRLIPMAIPSFEELGLPAVVERWVKVPRGLVLATGPTGAGQVDHAGFDGRPDQLRSGTATSSRSRTRSSTCTDTRRRR